MELVAGIFYIIIFLLIAIKLIRNKLFAQLLVILFILNFLGLYYLEYQFSINFTYILKKIFEAICMFIGALNFEKIYKLRLDIQNYSAFLSVIIPFHFLISILYSITFTVNYFSFTLDYLIFKMSVYINRKKEVYIFSCLNTQSITLAKSIYKHSKKSTILFCNVDYRKELSSKFIEDIKKINAFITRKQVYTLSYNRKRGMKIFLTTENDFQNINDLVTLSKISVLNSKDVIYPFIKYKANEIFLDNYIDGKATIHAINEIDLIVNDVLWNKPILPMENEKELNILIIGSGIIGKQFLKNVYWCTTMIGININITMLSNSIDTALSRLKCECPEIFNESNEVVGNSFKVRESKTISFIKMDVQNVEFNEYIKNTYNFFNYYFVALGTDELNANTSILIRQLLCKKNLEHKNIAPISTVIMNDILSSELEKVSVKKYKDTEGKEINYKISVFGKYADVYSYDSIIKNSLFDAGIRVNEIVVKNNKSRIVVENNESHSQPNNYQCNYRSSIAFVLSIKYKVSLLNRNYSIEECKGNESTNQSDNIQFANILNNCEYTKEQVIENEHDRWRCFYEMEGFESVSIEKIEKYKSVFGINNYMAKYHPALCEFNELENRKNRFKTAYKKNDEDLINNIDKIIEEIYVIKKNDNKLIKNREFSNSYVGK